MFGWIAVGQWSGQDCHTAPRGNMRSVTKFAVVVLLLSCGAAVRADSFTATSSSPGSSTFSNINVYYLNTQASSNPFGLTIPCSSGCNPNPFTTGTPPSGIETVTLFDTTHSGGAGFSISGITADQVTAMGSASIFMGTDANPNVTVGASISDTGTICAASACNGPSSPITLTYKGSGIFEVTDTSLNYVFSLSNSTTSTPEPSTLLLLGSGLLGLVGLGVRRKII